MTNKNVFGVVLIVLGVLFLLDKLNVIPFNIFFAGWWTLLLIIPALMSMSKQGVTVGNMILLIVGIVLLLREQGVDLDGYLLPGVLIILGIGLFIKR
ncbi:MAG: hypothetical protein CVV60_03515 [Tenericutes bacterium HGW-Tenericutes-5]|jgi:hypothetical protein|nr:MAG: hypothetical protein CVV60_03515 [Tenericutes bacterium HGW-Tenericutes-5]